MAQRPPTKRPREDALLENTEHSQEVLEEVCEICTAFAPATRAQRAELALRWFESDITWYGRWENWKVRDDEGSPSTRTDVKELISEWQAELSKTL